MPRDEANRRSGPAVVPGASHPTGPNDRARAEAKLDAQLGQTAPKNGDAGEARGTRMVQSDQHVRPLARSPARSPTRRVGGSTLSEPPRRSPVKPIPRPLPPPDPQRSEDVLLPLIALDKRRSGLDMFRSGDDLLPEPELPPTPERPDPEMATPPSGIHNSSPTKRPGRRKGRGKKGRTSNGSPLKQPPLKAAPAEAESRAATKALAKRSKERPAAAVTPARHSPRRLRNGHVARGIKPADPDAEKLAERTSLLAEIAALEADLSLVAAENERIRKATVFLTEPSSPQNQRDIVSFLRRHVLPPEKETADPTTDWLQAATNPVAFLPFGQSSMPLAELFTFPQPPAESATEEPPISHHPIPMTAAEELPYLQAFSPLSFRSEIVVLPQDEPDAPLLQKHLITATSTTPPDVFLAHIEMTVNTKSLRITELSVPRIEATAAPELRPFVDRIAVRSQKEAGSALVRNVTVLTWAMGEWVRVAVRRAKLWCAIDRLLRNKETLRGAVQALRIRKKRRNNNKRRDRGGANTCAAGSDTDDDDDELGGDAPSNGSSFSAAELRTHLGRTAMDVDVPPHPDDQRHDDAATVRIQWRIDFDWTGEAQSDLSLLLGVPGKCMSLLGVRYIITVAKAN